MLLEGNGVKEEPVRANCLDMRRPANERHMDARSRKHSTEIRSDSARAHHRHPNACISRNHRQPNLSQESLCRRKNLHETPDVLDRIVKVRRDSQGVLTQANNDVRPTQLFEERPC